MVEGQRTLNNDFELDSKIREAKQVITRVAAKSSVPLILNFSGGKDSMTLLDLVRQVTDNFVCFYMVSGIEFQESIDFVVEQCERMGLKLLMSRPSDYKGGFFERLPTIGYFPTVQNNTLWCNRDLKVRPQYVVLKREFGAKQMFFKLNGVRRYESSRRKKIHAGTKDFMRLDYHVAHGVMVFPILNWTDENVRDYLAANSIRVAKSPLYEKFGVSGCYWCPFYQAGIYKRILCQCPNLYDEVIEWEKKLNRPSVSGHVWLRDLKAVTHVE